MPDTRRSAPLQLRALTRENPDQLRWLGAVVGIFLLIYFLPAGSARFDNAVLEGIRLTQWYAQEHVILCLLPAFVIAGAMAAYLSQGAVMRYLGPEAPMPVAFGMASVSGTLLAVCSCTVLPLFGGIYRRGAGLGPAVAFLYSGPAINVMAIVVSGGSCICSTTARSSNAAGAMPAASVMTMSVARWGRWRPSSG